jgi:hypothetical protein
MSGVVMAAMGVASGNRVVLSNRTVSSNRSTPTHANARYALLASGDVQIVNNAGTQDVDDWIIPKAGMSTYECRMDVNSGSLTLGTTGAWLSLGTDRQWGNTTTGVQTLGFNGTLQIRKIGTTTVLASATIIINAEETV